MLSTLPVIGGLLLAASFSSVARAVPVKERQSGLNVMKLTSYHAWDQARRKRDGLGEESLIDVNDQRYVGNITIGTPGQEFVILFDTESGDLWINGPDSNTTTKKKFDTSASSTYVDVGQSFVDGYVGASVSGTLAEDSVCILGTCVAGQIFGLVNVTFASWDDDAMDGIMGVPVSGKTYESSSTWWATYFNDSGATPVLGYYAVREGDVDPSGEYTGAVPGSEMCIGCTDSSKYQGDLAYTTLQDHNDWRVTMDGIYLNGTLVDGTDVSNITIDTGNPSGGFPYIVGEPAYTALGGTVGTDGSVSFPSCDVPIATTFAIGVGGVQYEIKSTDLFFQNSDGTCGTNWGVGAQGGTGGCAGGTLWLKNVYTAFSFEGDYSLGLAPTVAASSIDSK